MNEIIMNLKKSLPVEEVTYWFKTYLLTHRALMEVILCLFIAVTTLFLTRHYNKKIQNFFAKSKLKKMIPSNAIRFVQHHMVGIVSSVLFGLAVVPYSFAEIPAHLISACAVLTFSWVVVNVITSLIENRLLSKFVTLVVWSIAALSMLGLYHKTAKILDSIFFKIGEVRVSPFLLIKGTIIIVILLWVAKAISNISEKNIRRAKNLSPSLRVLSSKMIRIFTYSIAILFGLNGFGVDLTAFTIFSGAVGVGVGFGLQKIVGNIVSGFIVLMDDSIKPGDIIQLDDKFGTVRKMGARYISVVAWDGMEHLIPNEDIITNKVINWTHSDKHILLSLDIGVSYKSDVHKVKELVLAAIRSVSRIMNEPIPQCYLSGFGDSSVNFRLYFWIDDPELGTMNVKSEVLFAVWDTFKENGIEIPFPQRDLHLRSVAPAELKELAKT